jgi:hypothetical protein
LIQAAQNIEKDSEFDAHDADGRREKVNFKNRIKVRAMD